MRPSHLRTAFFLYPLVFVLTALAAAQEPPYSYGTAGIEGLSGTPVVKISRPVGFGCPVSLRAQHGASATLQQAGQNRPKGLAQRLHLTLTDPQSRQIVSARVRVRGLSGKARTTQTLTSSIEPDSTRILDVHFSALQGKAVETDLWVPAMSAVLEIDLISITESAGSTRNFTAADGCRVSPDPLMLLSAR